MGFEEVLILSNTISFGSLSVSFPNFGRCLKVYWEKPNHHAPVRRKLIRVSIIACFGVCATTMISNKQITTRITEPI